MIMLILSCVVIFGLVVGTYVVDMREVSSFVLLELDCVQGFTYVSFIYVLCLQLDVNLLQSWTTEYEKPDGAYSDLLFEIEEQVLLLFHCHSGVSLPPL